MVYASGCSLKMVRLVAYEPRVKAIHPNAEVDVSGSHLVRVTLPEGDGERSGVPS